MISERLSKAINKQLNFELESGYIYKGMEAFFAQKGLWGFENFMKLQAEEEYDHHQRFAEFMYEADQEVEYEELPKPKPHYNSIEEAFQTALDHECEVTAKIEELYEIALEEKDYVAIPTLDWFLAEQVEEEDTFRGIMDTFEFAQGDKQIIFALNQKLAERKE